MPPCPSSPSLVRPYPSSVTPAVLPSGDTALPLLSGSSPPPRLQVKSILAHRPPGPRLDCNRISPTPSRPPDHKAENKWPRCQKWTEKSMPVYTDMTASAPEQLSRSPLQTLRYAAFFSSPSSTEDTSFALSRGRMQWGGGAH